MTKMKAIEAAVHILRKEGITDAFGVPGAAINPFYAAMKQIGGSFSRGGNPYLGTVEYLYVLDIELPRQAADSLYRDPYQIFKPAVPLTYFAPEEAAAGGYPMPFHHHYQVNIGSQ